MSLATVTGPQAAGPDMTIKETRHSGICPVGQALRGCAHGMPRVEGKY